ncbi:MAG: serine/threonine-protein kinase [Gemmataceae bacterium]
MDGWRKAFEANTGPSNGTTVSVLEKAPPTASRSAERALLHQRLRLLCILGVGGWPGVYAVLFMGLDPLVRAQRLDPACGVAILLTTLAPLIYGLILFRRPVVSYAFLRFVELSLLGMCMVCMAWIRYMTVERSLANLDGLTRNIGPLYASTHNNLLLLAIVICFGIVVPNPWKQTLVRVAFMMLVAFVTDVVVWSQYLPAGEEFLASSAITGCMTLFIGAGVTVFGSYRIERLTSQVSEAQRLLREFGQYKLIRRLGGGAMGEVHLAEHQLLKRPCAVKFIRPELAGDSGALSRFDREVKAMTRLTHWNVVEIYDYGRLEDGTFYYVMEYVPGMNLDEAVREFGPMPAARVVHILRQLCAGLSHAHSLGLVHRDIKPSNVILGERGGVCDTVKLLDFGLVKNQVLDGQTQVTRDGAVVGTPSFMSPEQARGSERLTHHTDLYSLGALGYFLLTGQPPFVRPSVIETMHAHIADPAVPPSHLCPTVPPDLEAVILTCLAKAPEKRYADADALDRALSECAQPGVWTQAEARQWWEGRQAACQDAPEHFPR